MRILLIEDEDHIREVAQVSLEAVAGWEVLAAEGGAEGVEMAKEKHPDAILLDVMMPDVDGPETLARLQKTESTSNIPVVFLTAKAQAAERRHLYDLGAVGVIRKPFDPMNLAHEVGELLGIDI
jgi:CheY-like chemotaxis protein